MSFSGSGAASGALAGGVAGASLGPIGAGVGAVAGGLFGGFFGPSEVNPNQDEINRLIGLQHQNDFALQQAALGKGPSQAQALLSHANAENAANQIGYAKTLGGDPALANRIAAEGVVKGNLENSHQAALLRSQEMQQAQEAYTGQLNAERGANAGFYGQQMQREGQNNATKQAWQGQLFQAGAKAGAGGMGGGGGYF